MSCSKCDKQQSEQSNFDDDALRQELKGKLEQVLENAEELREHLLRERFKVEHFVRWVRDDDPEPEEIEFIIPRDLMIKLLGGFKKVTDEIETDGFTEGAWVSGCSSTLGKYFKDGKAPMFLKKLDKFINEDEYFTDETGLQDYYLDGYEIRRQKSYGSNINFEIKVKFKLEDMVECCITEEDVPRRDAYYNGDVYMSASAYEDFTRCQV